MMEGLKNKDTAALIRLYAAISRHKEGIWDAEQHIEAIERELIRRGIEM